MEQSSERPFIPAASAAKSTVRFERRDWLALACALGLAALWMSVFGYSALVRAYPNIPALGAAAFVAAIYAAVLLYLGKEAKWNVWNICLVSGVGLLTLACCIYGDTYVRFINFILILCGSALAFFSLSGSADHALRNVRVVPETFLLTVKALFINLGKPFRAAAALGTGEKKTLSGVLIGLLAGLPVLALVIYLLATADAVFGRLFDSLAGWLDGINAGRETWRIFRTLLYALMLFSALYFLRHTPTKKTGAQKDRDAPPAAPFATVLCLLNAVYIVFVAIQFAFLFGGAETAAMKGGFAEYARSGFFQLVAVSAINLAAVLVASAAGGRKPLRILSTLLLILTCVILFSAFWRMRLYISVYGMSLLRAMTLWAIAFIAVCLILAAYKVWRPAFRLWPVFAALGLAGWIVFNFINIDARIADYNVNAYLDGRLEEVDIYYLARLSPDVVPALLRLRDAAGEDYTGAGDSDFYISCDISDAIDGALGRYHNPSSWRDWCYSYVRYK
ncbi:MAG: DUF4173 domain-containing protein [Clostridia bacterium]|nr:DUF4173 domain-containing protein [Clostridia bacterium]